MAWMDVGPYERPGILITDAGNALSVSALTKVTASPMVNAAQAPGVHPGGIK